MPTATYASARIFPAAPTYTRLAMRTLLLVTLLALAPCAQQEASAKKGYFTTAPAESRPDAPAPALEVETVDGETFSLAEACDDGYVLLAFVRGMW